MVIFEVGKMEKPSVQSVFLSLPLALNVYGRGRGGHRHEAPVSCLSGVGSAEFLCFESRNPKMFEPSLGVVGHTYLFHIYSPGSESFPPSLFL